MRVTDSTIRAYLLGQATEDEAARLETLLLDDEEVFAAVGAEEDDLFDDFARGTLSPGERSQFVARAGQERSKLLVAHALAARATRLADVKTGRVPSPSPRWHYWIPVAAAAAVIASIGIGYVGYKPPAPAPPTNATAAATPIASAVLAVTLGTTRSATSSPDVTVPPNAGLELRVRLDPADKYERYSMELRSASGEVVWQTEQRHELDPRDPTLVALIPSNVVAAGTFELAVRGLSGARSAEDLGFATVSIRR
jgi:hypothetical protein